MPETITQGMVIWLIFILIFCWDFAPATRPTGRPPQQKPITPTRLTWYAAFTPSKTARPAAAFPSSVNCFRHSEKPSGSGAESAVLLRSGGLYLKHIAKEIFGEKTHLNHQGLHCAVWNCTWSKQKGTVGKELISTIQYCTTRRYASWQIVKWLSVDATSFRLFFTLLLLGASLGVQISSRYPLYFISMAKYSEEDALWRVNSMRRFGLRVFRVSWTCVPPTLVCHWPRNYN